MPASIRTRLVAALLLVAVLTAAVLSLYFLTELEAYGLRKLEERLDAQSRLVAALLGSAYEKAGTVPGATPEIDRDIAASALQGVSADLATRLRVLDAEGLAVADSDGSRGVGSPYGDRREVRLALGEAYGAATRVAPDGRVALYVAAPIRVDGSVVGVAYSSATTFSIRTLLRDYRGRLALLALGFAALAILLAEGLARWLARPLSELEAAATTFAAGDHSARARPTGSREIRAVAGAFNRLADEVETLVAELREEERRKSRFVSDVSHELRTPLTAIRGTAETLLDGEVDAEDTQRFLANIAREAERLGRLADELLTLQRVEGTTGELPFRRVELADVIERAVASFAPITEARDVSVEVRSSGGLVLGDPDRLGQVVSNLLDNASRHTPAGGTVTIELSAEAAVMRLDVVDGGPGIAEEDLPRVFDRFFRSQVSRDRSSGGSGLGLAIVKAIVKSHSGEVRAANRSEGGARFTVVLPRLRD